MYPSLRTPAFIRSFYVTQLTIELTSTEADVLLAAKARAGLFKIVCLQAICERTPFVVGACFASLSLPGDHCTFRVDAKTLTLLQLFLLLRYEAYFYNPSIKVKIHMTQTVHRWL